MSFFSTLDLLYHIFLSGLNPGTGISCGTGMFIPDPDLYPSWIPDTTKATKGGGTFRPTFFGATNITKLIVIFDQV
jgi:hypothetical protein